MANVASGLPYPVCTHRFSRWGYHGRGWRRGAGWGVGLRWLAHAQVKFSRTSAGWRIVVVVLELQLFAIGTSFKRRFTRWEWPCHLWWTAEVVHDRYTSCWQMVHGSIQALDHRDLVHLSRKSRCESVWETWEWRKREHFPWGPRESSEKLRILWCWKGWWEGVHWHATASARWRIVPHVGTHVYLEVTLGRECFVADGALKWFFAGVSAAVDLQGWWAGERFGTDGTDVAQVRTLDERRSIVRRTAVIARGRRCGLRWRSCCCWRTARGTVRTHHAATRCLCWWWTEVVVCSGNWCSNCRCWTLCRTNSYHAEGWRSVGTAVGWWHRVSVRLSWCNWTVVRVTIVSGAVARMAFWKVSDLVGQHVLLHVSFSGEASIADFASEGAFFGVTSEVYVECALAGEGFKADGTRCSHLTRTTKWRLRWDTLTHHLEVKKTHVHALHYFFSAFFIFSAHSTVGEARWVGTASWWSGSTDWAVLHAAGWTATIFRRMVTIGHARRHLVLVTPDNVGHLFKRLAGVVVSQGTSCVNGLHSILQSLKWCWVSCRRKALDDWWLVDREVWWFEWALLGLLSCWLITLQSGSSSFTAGFIFTFIWLRRLTSLGRGLRRLSIHLPFDFTVIVFSIFHVFPVYFIIVSLHIIIFFFLFSVFFRLGFPKIKFSVRSRRLEWRGSSSWCHHGVREAHRMHRKWESGEGHWEGSRSSWWHDHIWWKWYIFGQFSGMHADVLLQHQSISELLVANWTLKWKVQRITILELFVLTHLHYLTICIEIWRDQQIGCQITWCSIRIGGLVLWTPMWVFRFPFVVNALPQILHLNGLSPVWILQVE